MKIRLVEPQEIRQHIWKELVRAGQDRHHEWRTPVLATTSLDGTVNARTVVLREVDAGTHTLKVFTDGRSSKVQELAHQPCGVFVFWSKRLSWQLRVRTTITTHTQGPEVQGLWNKVKQSAAAGDYLSPAAPGSVLRSAENTPLLHHHFTLMTAQVSDIDWLELGREGHRRAAIGNNTWEWLTP
jgi:pyridoxine/pyridoxamine 5'-phosphate oxidase